MKRIFLAILLIGISLVSSASVPVINATDYGVLCDGSTDDTSSMVAALAAVQSSPTKILMMPGGSCPITAGVLSGPPNLHLIGQGQFATTFTNGAATGNYLTIDGGTVIQDVGFASTAIRTSGCFVCIHKTASAMLGVISRVAMAGAYRGVYYDGTTAQLTVNDSTCSAETSDDVAPGSGCVLSAGGGIMVVNNLVHGPASPPNRVLCVVCVQDGNVTINGGQYLQGKHAILVNPTSGQAVWITAKGAWLDSCVQQCVFAQPTGTGTIAFLDVTSPWIAPMSGNAVDIIQTGTSTITIVNMVGNIITNYTPNSGSGIYLGGIMGGGAKIAANTLSAFSWGIGIAPGTNNFHVDANTFVNLGGPAVVVQGGPSNNYSVTNNLSLGTSGGISDAGAGPNKLVANNH